jgi:hypothetical protein
LSSRGADYFIDVNQLDVDMHVRGTAMVRGSLGRHGRVPSVDNGGIPHGSGSAVAKTNTPSTINTHGTRGQLAVQFAVRSRAITAAAS